MSKNSKDIVFGAAQRSAIGKYKKKIIMNSKDKDEFKIFVNTKRRFNPHIMFISKKNN